jgi:hypothetical protein
MNPTDEHRRYSRIPFDAQAYLAGSGQRWESQLLDISLKGALLVRPAQWQGRLGDVLDLELVVDQGALVIRMQTDVAHIEADHLGLHCRHIDLDSITHLRRLVELNLGDASQLNRELHALSHAP